VLRPYWGLGCRNFIVAQGLVRLLDAVFSCGSKLSDENNISKSVMTNQDQPTQDHPAPTYYEPKPANLSTVQDHGQNDREKALPLQLSLNLAIAVIVVLLFITANYYGFLR
jgi:hypothetical protein